MGDAAHMASPRTGAGAQVAMMDAIAFGDCMRKSTSIEAALKIYNVGAVDRAK
jgi:2-polyprenyl-6-methoxyphenol hydroxylase-like FAD-dependent oxidoreductase